MHYTCVEWVKDYVPTVCDVWNGMGHEIDRLHSSLQDVLPACVTSQWVLRHSGCGHSGCGHRGCCVIEHALTLW